jgi:hypothetical protein
MGRGASNDAATATPRTIQLPSLFDIEMPTRGIEGLLFEDPNELHVFEDGWRLYRTPRYDADPESTENPLVDLGLDTEGIGIPRQEQIVKLLDKQGVTQAEVIWHGEQPWVLLGIAGRTDARRSGSVEALLNKENGLSAEAVVSDEALAHLRDYFELRGRQLGTVIRWMPEEMSYENILVYPDNPRCLLRIAEAHQENPRSFTDGYEPALAVRFDRRELVREFIEWKHITSEEITELCTRTIGSFLATEMAAQRDFSSFSDVEAVAKGIYILAVDLEAPLPALIEEIDDAIRELTADYGYDEWSRQEIAETVEERLKEEKIGGDDERYERRREQLEDEALDGLRDEEAELANAISQYLYDMNELFGSNLKASLHNQLPSIAEARALRLEQDRTQSDQPQLG